MLLHWNPTFVKSCACWLGFSLLIFASSSTSFAQPTSDRQQVEQLQRQLNELQQQLQTLQPPAGVEHLFGNPRVKAIGTQRPQRPVEPIVDDLIQIRLYDLSDIFAVSPHYPAVMPNEIDPTRAVFPVASEQRMRNSGMGGNAGGGGGVFNYPPKMLAKTPFAQEAETMNLSAAQISMKQLVEAIQATVAPEEWGDETDEAKIQLLGNTMLIAATGDMHQQIANLLNLFRQHWGKLRTVSVEAYWIRATAAKTNELMSLEHQRTAGAGVVQPDAWQSFLKSAQSENRLAYSTTLTSHNNQTVSGLSGRIHRLVTDANPLKAKTISMPIGDDEDQPKEIHSTIVGMQPLQQTIHCGAILQVTPLATRGGNFVILDLHSKVNELLAISQANKQIEPSTVSDDTTEAVSSLSQSQDVPKSRSVFAYLSNGKKIEMELDPSDYATHQLNTTLRCPQKETVLAGGMAFDNDMGSDNPNLYLFVRVLVHTINEDQSDWTPEK